MGKVIKKAGSKALLLREARADAWGTQNQGQPMQIEMAINL